MTDKKNDDLEFVKAVKLASHSYNDLEHLRDPSSRPPEKSRGTGTGQKVKAPEVRVASFHWFVALRESLKEGLPRCLFKLKARQLYAEWLIQNSIPKKDQLKFSNKWIKSWENQYVVGLRRPKKWYSIQREDVLIRLQDHLHNFWTVRRFFKEKYRVDPL